MCFLNLPRVPSDKRESSVLDTIYSLLRVFDPLGDNILLSRPLEAHKKMFNALHLLRRHLVGDDVHTGVHLHSVRIDDPCPPIAMRCRCRLLR